MTAPELLPSSFYMWGASEDCLTAGYWSFDPPTGGGNPTTRFVALVPGAAPEVAALIAEARREGWNAAKAAAILAVAALPVGSDEALTMSWNAQQAIRALKEETP